MREWLMAQLDAGLPAFQGSMVEGTLAVNETALNELLAQWRAQPRERTPSPAPFDAGALLDKVSNVAIRLEPSRMLIDFTLKV